MPAKFAYLTKADHAFFPGVRALVASLAATGTPYPVVVLDAGLERTEVDELISAGCRVQSIRLNHEARPASVVGTHYNAAIFALMHIGKLDVDRFVHLDADIVVFESIDRFACLLDEHEFVGVPDHPPLTLADNVGGLRESIIMEELFPGQAGLGLKNIAVNAGVFGARMTTFRSLIELMQKVYESDLELPRRDQTMLNIALAVLGPSQAMLPVHFNFRHFFRRDAGFTWTGVRLDRGLLRPYLVDDPISVVHYVGPIKPWDCRFDRTSTAYEIWRQFCK